jgi:hypothetical protein
MICRHGYGTYYKLTCGHHAIAARQPEEFFILPAPILYPSFDKGDWYSDWLQKQRILKCDKAVSMTCLIAFIGPL